MWNVFRVREKDEIIKLYWSSFFLFEECKRRIFWKKWKEKKSICFGECTELCEKKKHSYGDVGNILFPLIISCSILV